MKTLYVMNLYEVYLSPPTHDIKAIYDTDRSFIIEHEDIFTENIIFLIRKT